MKNLNIFVYYLFIILFSLFNTPFSEFCNYHCTLFETDTFYLTQPYSKNITIDLENFQTIFQTFPNKLKHFQQHFNQYETEANISSLEPMTLYPFTSELNIFRTTDKILGRNSFMECAKNNGSLLALTPSNIPLVTEIMKKLKLERIPFNALPRHGLLSIPNLEILDIPSFQKLEAIVTKTPAFLLSNGSFLYPTAMTQEDMTSTTTTTTTPNPNTTPSSSSTTTSSPNTLLENQYHYALCTKPNNPWDRDILRKNWLKLTPQIRNAIKFLEKLKNTYTDTAKTLQKLPSNPLSEISRNIKFILPSPLQSVVDFLDSFSSKSQWETTKPSALAQFSSFVRDTFKLVKLFNLDSSITNIRQKHHKTFRLLTFDDLHWKDFFDLDEELYGLAGPASVTPFEFDPSKPNLFKAHIRFRVFNRKDDKNTIYLVKPNIIKRSIIDVKSLLHTSKYSLVSKEDFVPLECTNSPSEIIKICNKIQQNDDEQKHHHELIEGGSARFNKHHDQKHAHCPMKPPNIDPII